MLQDALEEELDDLYDLQLKNEKTVDSNEKKGEVRSYWALLNRLNTLRVL